MTSMVVVIGAQTYQLARNDYGMNEAEASFMIGVLGLVLGLFLALVRIFGAGIFQFLARIYIDIFRSIPLLVLLIVIYYALPFVGIRLSPFAAATSACPLSQPLENSLSLGMSALAKGVQFLPPSVEISRW